MIALALKGGSGKLDDMHPPKKIQLSAGGYGYGYDYDYDYDYDQAYGRSSQTTRSTLSGRHQGRTQLMLSAAYVELHQ
ncbi:hypothetical protein [Xanthomonas hortorum]|uniref:hypothetical protein n=1 Tax=Xanthomonas hortorum TaxID=56454 RepID=UPI0020433EA6|nr:hypothetical protein [Xanthomonas hortorum]MCM5537787.1 hypothetical protein [Xanthomonas hortorum pv. pelargonii]MCM5551477.1 hypothetical protein [Xanthomonas hortorum pv. pelargonii]MCM5634932.1 hypothetical protein [Xanthomonas hortorum pv. pelargonii]MCM5651535.1 hypothetical protein [Xanthomonas hortorum pv. pelargonii]MDC8636027.1 hypothetical protein [Xanthomonas hortorum pv. pelargonii]